MDEAEWARVRDLLEELVDLEAREREQRLRRGLLANPRLWREVAALFSARRLPEPPAVSPEVLGALRDWLRRGG